jgi:2-keto-3-deoxy-6-phosphogluconate aldolase
MRSKSEIIQRLKATGVVAVIRAESAADFIALVAKAKKA